jgi:hypothetical protein
MSDLRTVRRILFIDTGGIAGELVDNINAINEWIWQRTPFARWIYRTDDSIKIEDVKDADLGIFAWSDHQAAAQGLEILRQLCGDGDIPLLIVSSQSAREEVIRSSMTEWHASYLVLGHDVPRPEDLEPAFQKLGLVLKPYDLRLDFDENDPFTMNLFESFGRKRDAYLGKSDRTQAYADVRPIGREHLEHLIQRFFPEDKTVDVHPVGGGWSGDSLCRVHAGPGKNEHFIKFYSDKKKYEEEFKNHLHAEAVLKGHTVSLRRVPDFGQDEPQAEAFPGETRPPTYPICFDSASEGESACKTLKELYVRATDAFVDEAIAKLLTIVPGEFDPTNKDDKVTPWGYDANVEFQLTGDLKRSVLDAIDDLDIYGSAMCADWPNLRTGIRNLMYLPLSKHEWLTEPRSVAMGYIHGDANSRNCLFNPSDCRRLKLIDCGQFRKRWRLVSDLAVIERELKIVLLGTDQESGGYLDLDAARLSSASRPRTWCAVEKASIEKGLDYTRGEVDRTLAADPSIRRAYRPIARIRARAKEAAGRFDLEGRHYFAALLYWTLEILKEPAVRRPKKLLALFSAAQIIAKFQRSF